MHVCGCGVLSSSRKQKGLGEGVWRRIIRPRLFDVTGLVLSLYTLWLLEGIGRAPADRNRCCVALCLKELQLPATFSTIIKRDFVFFPCYFNIPHPLLEVFKRRLGARHSHSQHAAEG